MDLKIRNLIPTDVYLSIEGSDKTSAKVNLAPSQEVSIAVRSVQFDQTWLETLARYMEQGKAAATLEGYSMTPDEIRELKHTDLNEVVGQYLESKERGAPDPNLGHGRYYSGADGHPHYRAGNGADYDLTIGGTYLEQVTHRICVDGGRTDSYIEVGSASRPFKTIQGGVNASSPGDCISVASGTYHENVVMAGDRHIDADSGTVLAPVSGIALTIMGTLAPDLICFVRGLNITVATAGDWAIKVDSIAPSVGMFVVYFNSVVTTSNAANGFWIRKGGMYLPDDGGMIGDAVSPAVCARIGDTGVTGATLQAAAYSFNVGSGGTVFDILPGNNVNLEGSDIGSNLGSTGAIVAVMQGGTSMANTQFSALNCRATSSFGGYVRATGQYVRVRIDGDHGEDWANFAAPVISMEGGDLSIYDTNLRSENCVLSLNPTLGTHLEIHFGNSVFETQGNSRPLEVTGDVGGTIYNCSLRAWPGSTGDPFGAAFFNHTGSITVAGGEMRSNNPAPYAVCDQRNGNLWLLGGVDIVSDNPLAPIMNVAFGATVHRGHCNLRGGTAPLIAGTENVLPSTFGDIYLGPLANLARIGVWVGIGLPGPGYAPAGSLLIWTACPGGPMIFINRGTLLGPNWVHPQSYMAGTPANWVGAPTDLAAAVDRLAAALVARTGGVPIP